MNRLVRALRLNPFSGGLPLLRSALPGLVLLMGLVRAAPAPGEDTDPAAPLQLPVHRPEQLTARTDPVAHFAVSPDGARLVYAAARGEGAGAAADLWLRSADPSKVVLPRRLTDDPTGKRSPAFSPDGKRVAFVGTGYDVKGDIYLLPVDEQGAEPTRLTGRETGDGGPCFSSDGRTLYFHRTDPGGTTTRIVAMDLTGSGGAARTVAENGAFPAVSPDGGRLAFVTFRRHSGGDIRLLDLADGTETPVTDDPVSDLFPAWSPEGGRIYFSRIPLDTDGDGRITASDNPGVYRAAPPGPGGGPVQSHPVTPAGYSAFAPRLAGDRLFFLSGQGGVVNCWSLPREGAIPSADSAGDQMALARRIDGKIPPEPFLSVLAYARVAERFPEAGETAAQAVLRMGEIYREIEMPAPALDAFRRVVADYGSVLPQGPYARIEAAAAETRIALSGGADVTRRADLLDRGLDRLAELAAAHPGGPVFARTAIARARLILAADGAPDRITPAVDQLDQVLADPEAGPGPSAEAMLLKGDLYARLGVPGEVAPIYLSVIRTHPGARPWADRAVDRILDIWTDAMAGASLEAKVERLRRGSAEHRETAPALAAGAINRVGDLYYAADDWPSAKNAYRQVLDQFPHRVTQTAAARFSLAEILYREERFSRALSLYETEIAARPYEDLIYQLARTGFIRKSVAAGEHLYRLGEIPSARAKFRELIRYDETLVAAHRGYIKCAAAMGDAAGTAVRYRKKMAESPDDPVAVYAAALALTYLEDRASLEQARDLLERAIAMDGRVAYFHQTRGYVLEVLETVHGAEGTLEPALESYKRALFLNDPETNPENAANLLLNLGNASFLLHQYENAFHYYTRRLDTGRPFADPDTEILFHRRLGAAAFQARAPEETISAFAKALALIEAHMAPKAPSDAFDRVRLYITDRVIPPVREIPSLREAAEALARDQADLNKALYRLTQADLLPPPSEGWRAYRDGMAALLERQKGLNPRAVELAEKAGLRELDPEAVSENLTAMARRVETALEFPERLVLLRAEMLDRQGLALQEAGRHQEAMDAFGAAFDLNRALGTVENLARNRRSVGYNAYLLAGSRTGEERRDLLRRAAGDFAQVIDLVRRHGVPEEAPAEGGEGLVGLSVAVAMDETAATRAAHGFTEDQEIRLAEAFLSRIHTELGDLSPAEAAVRAQLADYPPDRPVPEGDRYGVALLFHRAGHLAVARKRWSEAFAHFARSAELSLSMGNAVSAATNTANLAHVLVHWGPSAEDGAGPRLEALDRRAARLLARAAVDDDVRAGYHNTMGVHLFAMAVPAGADLQGAARRARGLQRAGVRFHRGLAALGEPPEAPDRKRLSLRATIHLNLARTARAGGEKAGAEAHFGRALDLSDRGGIDPLRWRALAGLGRLDEALAALERVTLLGAGCGPGEITETFGPLVAEAVDREGPEAGFVLAERIGELERFNRMAVLAGPFTEADKALFRDLHPRLRRIADLRERVAAAQGEERAYLTGRLERETALFEDRTGPEGEGLPDLIGLATEGDRRDLLLRLLGLAALAEAGEGAAAEDALDRYHDLFEKAVSALEPGEPPGLLALFGPNPADPMAVMAGIDGDGALIRWARTGNPKTPYLRFRVTADALTAEPAGRIDPACPSGTCTLAFEDPAGIPAGSLPVALSATHFARAAANRKPFRRSLLAVPLPPDPPEGYAVRSFEPVSGRFPRPVHTLLLGGAIHLTGTVPTRAGEVPDRFLGMTVAKGRRLRLERFPAKLADLNLTLATDVASGDHYLLGHLFAIFGAPTLVVPAGPRPADPAAVRKFLDAYLDHSAAGAAVAASGDGPPVLRRMGFRGMDPDEAARYALTRFADEVKKGRADLAAGRYETALSRLENGIRIALEAPSLAKYLPALYQLAREAAYRAGDLDRAVTHAAALADLLERNSPDTQAHAEAVLRLGVLHARREDYLRAIPLLESAAETLAALDLTDERAAALASLGIALENATEYDRALVRFRSAASLGAAMNQAEFLAQQETNIGRIYDLRLSQYAVAMRHYDKALEIYRSLDRKDGAAQALLDVGRCYRLLGNFPEAERRYREALTIAETPPADDRLRSKIIIEQANNAWYQGRYEAAFRDQRAAYELAVSGGWPLLQVVDLNTAGLIWWTLGDHDKALRRLDEALELAGSLEARRDEVATTLNNQGQVLREMGRYKEAMGKFEAALAIDEELGSRWAIAHDLRNQGLTLLRTGAPEEALPLFRRAAETAEAIGNRINAAKARFGLGEALRELGRPGEAGEAYRKALELSRDMALREFQWRSLHGLARLDIEAGDREGAVTKLYDAVEVIETMRADIKIEQLKEGFLADKLAVYETLVTLLADLGRPTEAFEVAERSRSRNFVDLLGNQRLSLASALDQERYDRQQTLKARISEHEALIAQSADPEERASYGSALHGLRDDYDDLMLEIQAENPQLASLVSVSPVRADHLREILDPGLVLLAYYVVPEQVLCWVIRNNGMDLVRVPVGRDLLAETLLDYRRMTQNLEPLTETSEKLFRWLAAPVLDRLEGAAAVGIIPHNALHYLSFATLADGEGYLIDRFPLFYLPAASLFDYAKARRTGNRNPATLAIGNPDLGEAALELPFAEHEVRTIQYNLPDIEILTGAKATEAWVVENIGRFGIIHLASHGEFDPINPLFSSVKLAEGAERDGDLEAGEVFGLTIEADLVVLSACQTGLGKVTPGDDVVGLNRAFFYAGTHAIISSLWRVSDVSTALLVKHFYRGYGRYDKAESLRRAIRRVRQDYPHPGYWGPFVLVGDYR